jgi:hypothetical protein
VRAALLEGVEDGKLVEASMRQKIRRCGGTAKGVGEGKEQADGNREEAAARATGVKKDVLKEGIESRSRDRQKADGRRLLRIVVRA